MIMYTEKNKLQVTVIFFAMWMTATYFAIPPCRHNQNTMSEVAELKEKLNSTLKKLETLKQQNIKLRRILYHGPTIKYENLRRRIYSSTKEFWYYVSHELNKRKMSLNEFKESIKILQDEVTIRKWSLLSDQEKLPAVDGHAEWRSKEARTVSDLVQRRLRYLQNPKDCRRAKKVVCVHDNCGFGCQLHHIVYCLIFAYATERTLILDSKGWRYNNKGWEYVFHPISDTCTNTYNDTVWKYPASHEVKVMSLPALYYIKPKPKFLPLAVPVDLAHRIIRFNGDPVSWWIGQMIKFLLKPRKHIQEVIDKTVVKMNIQTPVVGVHIRHTDKVGVEATRHDVSEYMRHVGEYYAQLELTRTLPRRSVYLATDDPRVLKEARNKYPQYTIYGDVSIARSAATHRRYTPLSLTGLLVDLHMLARCDYLVCTFSSQLGRAVYEMMQNNRVDASTRFSSLDDLYHFVGQNPQDRIVIMPVNHNGDIQMGDKINVSSIRTGYSSKGDNTNKSEIVPWYKTADNLQLYPFPEYKEVPHYTNTT